MNTAIKYDPINGIRVTDDNKVLTGVLSSLAHNNTFFPNVKRICITESENSMTVFFKDDTWVTVKKSDTDENDYMTALMYAILKRLFGTPNKNGYVTGNGFMGKMKAFLDNAESEASIKAAKERRIADKLAADKKAHEEAVARRSRNPSMGIRMASLEDKFDRLMEMLGGDIPSKKSKGFRNFFNK